MTPKRSFFGMVAVTVLLVLLSGGATYLGYTMIVKEGKKLEDAKLNEAVASEKLKLVSQAKKDIAEYEELEQIAKRVVPQEKDQARTVLELVNIARESGIDIVNVSFPASELGQIKAKGKSKKAPTAREGENAAAQLTQLTPVEGLTGVYSMEISVEADPEQTVTYSQLLGYLERLEKNRRTAQVSNLSIVPDAENQNLVTFSLTLKSYVKP